MSLALVMVGFVLLFLSLSGSFIAGEAKRSGASRHEVSKSLGKAVALGLLATLCLISGGYKLHPDQAASTPEAIPVRAN